MIITDEKILRTPCSPVLEKDIGELKSLLDNELQRSAILGSPGIGLSLPQIGIFQTMAIVRVDNDHYVDLVNCKITAGFDKEIFDQEGCLSFPDRFEKTLRYQEILIESNAVYPHRFVCTGLMAVVAQHET
ncbi:MAG TPA: peptide deformylase, partial [Candidatus Babeliales bacterium]|nr:peptide deformylase [Candidatus Babeliales bacterium]